MHLFVLMASKSLNNLELEVESELVLDLLNHSHFLSYSSVRRLFTECTRVI